MVVKAIKPQAPKKQKPIRDKSIVVRQRKRQKAAARQITREAEDKKAEQSNLHSSCFVNEMNISELAENFFGVVFTLCKCGRMEGETISQSDGQQQSTSDQSKLNESKPEAFKQRLKKLLFLRPSRRPKQTPNQSHWGQASRILHVMGSSGTSVRLENSLFSKILSTSSSARINEPMEQGLPVPRSAQDDPKESTETDLAAIKQTYETCRFKEKSSAERRSNSRNNQAKKGKESTNAVNKESILVSQSRLSRLIGARPSKKSKTLSPKSSARINEPMEQGSPVPGSAQHDPKESTETDMAAKSRMSGEQLLKKKLCSRPSRRPKQVPNQSHWGQAARNLRVMGSSGTSVRSEDSLLSKTLSTNSSVSGEELLKKQLCSRPSRRLKQVPNQSHWGQPARNLHVIGSSGTSVRSEDSLLSKTFSTKSFNTVSTNSSFTLSTNSSYTLSTNSSNTLSTNSSNTLSTKSSDRINEPMQRGLPVPRSAQDDPKESTETDMAAIKQMYKTCRFKKESSAERSSNNRNNKAKKSKESTNAVNKESILISQSRLSRLIGARPSKKSKNETKVTFAANKKF